MEKTIIKEERVKRHILNCRIGRSFALFDQEIYSKNASAVAKSAALGDTAVVIRARSHCKIKPPGRRSFG